MKWLMNLMKIEISKDKSTHRISTTKYEDLCM